MLTQVSSHLLIVLSLLLFPFGCATESDSEEVPGNPSPAGMDDGTSGSTSVDSQAGGGANLEPAGEESDGGLAPATDSETEGGESNSESDTAGASDGEAPSEEGGEGPITPPSATWPSQN